MLPATNNSCLKYIHTNFSINIGTGSWYIEQLNDGDTTSAGNTRPITASNSLLPRLDDIDSNEDKDKSFTNSYVTNNEKGHDKNNTQHKIPTLPKIAQKVAKLEKTQLDEKQYIAY